MPRPAGRPVVRPDPPARRRPRLRAQPEGLQAGSAGLSWLDPRGLPEHPGPDHRDAAKPPPGPGGRRPGRRGGAPPGPRAPVTLPERSGRTVTFREAPSPYAGARLGAGRTG